MATQQRGVSKAAAKRRAAARRRNREALKRVGALFFVAIFVLGGAATAFVFQTTQTSQNITPTPNASVASGAGSVQVTPLIQVTAAAQQTPGATDASAFVQKAEDAAKAGNWDDAITNYKLALGFSASNPSIQFELGKAYIQKQDYKSAVEQLQAAVAGNPTAAFVSEAQSLIDTYKDKAGAGSQTPSTPAPAASPTK